jgi:protein phosphatase
MEMNKTIKIPELSLVVLLGPDASADFADKHFKSTEIFTLPTRKKNLGAAALAIDHADFQKLRAQVGEHLQEGKLTVINAGNLPSETHRSLLNLAKEADVRAIAIILDTDAHAPEGQIHPLQESLKKEGFRHIHHLKGKEEINAATIEHQPLWNNLKHECGPFDLIGDIHGCYDELLLLLEKLGYKVTSNNAKCAEDLTFSITCPEKRRIIFLGDLVDRGPKSPQVVKLVMTMVRLGQALCVAGNHDAKLLKKLNGKNVRLTHGLPETLEQLEMESPQFHEEMRVFLDSLIGHYVLDEGRLVVAHAGMKETYQGRTSGRVREFALYGETTGEIDEYGLPERYNWAADYRGKAMVVYGHIPQTQAVWQNGTICLDTGCVYGGNLSALRYPEKELVQVKAHKQYYKPQRPLL